jgi:hypothetical protein
MEQPARLHAAEDSFLSMVMVRFCSETDGGGENRIGL